MTKFRLPKTSKIRPGMLHRAAKHDARVRSLRMLFHQLPELLVEQ